MASRKLSPARQRSLLTLSILAVLLSCIGAYAETPAPALRILGRTPLPPGHSVAKDIRWASDDSVYVVRALDGVFEVVLDGTLRKRLVPAVETFGAIHHYDRLAVSDKILAVASRDWSLAWRQRESQPDRTFLLENKPIALTEDMDVHGDNYLLFGIPKDNDFASDGAIVWIGTLSSGLKDLKPVLFDKGGAGVPNFAPCRGVGLGVARFLRNGSFLVVPGFEKGVLLFTADGHRVRSWKSEEIGLDSDCSGLGAQGKKDEVWREPEVWQSWLNRHRTVDDVLSLPQGPGLLVRSWEKDGTVRWQLKVLTPTRVETYSIPIEGRRPTDRLRGDVRDGRIALLLSASGFFGWYQDSDPKGEVVLAEVPNP